MHKPDFDKHQFTITIDIFENCQTITVRSAVPDKVIDYQQIIGALDIAKMRYMFDQSGVNAEEYRKWKAAQDKKKVKQTK